MRTPVLASGTMAALGVLTATYSVVLPFHHGSNHLGTLFRNHWKQVCQCLRRVRWWTRTRCQFLP